MRVAEVSTSLKRSNFAPVADQYRPIAVLVLPPRDWTVFCAHKCFAIINVFISRIQFANWLVIFDLALKILLSYTHTIIFNFLFEKSVRKMGGGELWAPNNEEIKSRRAMITSITQESSLIIWNHRN